MKLTIYKNQTQVFSTKIGKVGVAICWDQWFPEAARAMALQGADILLYPTAIGTEPQDPTIDSADHWQRVMQGHAAANVSLFLLFFNFFRHHCDKVIRIMMLVSSIQ